MKKGPGEIAKCLLSKVEKLSLSPRAHVKQKGPGVMVCVCDFRTGEAGPVSSWVSQPGAVDGSQANGRP